MASNLKIVYGGAAFMGGASVEQVTEVLDNLEKAGVYAIDTAQSYGDSELLLGQAKAAARGFQFDTKVTGGLFSNIYSTKDNVIKAGKESLEKLDTNQIDVYYIHAPDRKVPFKDTIEGINELYKAGVFKRFGLSNFTAEEVEDVVRISKENNFVVPTVYQGNYNAAGRVIETKLFPVLRKHNIAFYAYSPIAGGFLTKTPEDITVHNKGRFGNPTFLGQLYNGLYNTPGKLDFLAKFGKIAADAGVSQAELAYRWVWYHSYLTADKGDAIIIGPRSPSQLHEIIQWAKKGPLGQETADKLDVIYKDIEGEAIMDNFNDYITKVGGVTRS